MFIVVNANAEDNLFDVNSDNFVGIFETEKECKEAIEEDFAECSKKYYSDPNPQYAVIEFENSHLRYATVKQTYICEF